MRETSCLCKLHHWPRFSPSAGANQFRFLDGQSLGASQGATEMTPFVGIESFFLPAEVDFRLGGPAASGETGGQGGGSENPLGGDVWW